MSFLLHKLDKKKDNFKEMPQILMVPEFEALYNYDKTKTKKLANNLLLYIANLCDIGSMYQRVPIEIRKSKIKTDLFLDDVPGIIENGHQDHALFKEAIDKYKVLQAGPEYQTYEALGRMIDEINRALDRPLDEDADDYMAEVQKKQRLAKEIEKITEDREKIRQSINEKLDKKKAELQVKGSKSLTPLEMGLFDPMESDNL